MADTGNGRVVARLAAPFDGTVIPLEAVPDAAFAEKMLGDGLAIIPQLPADKAAKITLASPLDGEVTLVADTAHAVGLAAGDVEILLHVGIDTVKLDGAGFRPLVAAGQVVKIGAPLLEFDGHYLSEHAPSLATPLVFTDGADGRRVVILKSGAVQRGEAVAALVE